MTLYRWKDRQPHLAADCWVAPSAQVIGGVEAGSECSIWFGAVLRGDIEPIRLGARCNIQENAVLHTDQGFPLTIGDDCTIGHLAMLHGCTIGEGSLIGMHATVLNGATIGAESLVGAGSLVPEGKSYPDGVLILGTPARVHRTLTAEERQRLRHSAAHYVAQARAFREGLQPIDGSLASLDL